MHEAYMSKEEEILKMILAYSLFTNLGIILAYLTTYVILNRHIRKLQREFASKLTLSDIRGMNANLESLYILFVSICQIYGLRLTRDIL